MATTKIKSVTVYLKAQHDEVKKLFKEVIDDERWDDQDTIEEICDKLLAHMEAEEKHFYPVVGPKIEDPDLVKEANLEHADAKKIIKAIGTTLGEDVALKVKLEELQLMIQHHIKEEESELFPQVEEKCSEDDLAQMYAAVEECFETKLAEP